MIGLLFLFYILNKQDKAEMGVELKEIVQQEAIAPSPVSFSYTCQSGKNVYDVLTETANVESSDSSFGKMVTAINGKEQGGGKFWLYSIDNVEASVSASTYICQGSEQIRWVLK